MAATFSYVTERPSFPEEEEKVLKFWTENHLFEKSNTLAEGKPIYSFYDGPPFATGLPHYGHILAGTMKDIITRYAYQTGHSVERRFGWDCHGLPVEHEIDKTYNIQSRQDVLDMGIEEYNRRCKEIVMRYASQWKQIIGRMGRWIDFENDYKTMDRSFMESIWWVCKTLYDKGLVYKSFRVMPYSTACTTPLSNFEVNLNYKDISDPSIIITFPLKSDPSVEVLAWTTTPWTLPSNLAITVHPDFDYVTLYYEAKNKKWVLAKARLEWFCSQLQLDIGKDLVIINEFKGSELLGKQYEPLFKYFYDSPHPYKQTAFRILTATYVTDDSGTGVVHCAPSFGEDDYKVCQQYGVWEGSPIVCPINEDGYFTDEVTDFKGMYFKSADKHIRESLKQMGRLIHSSTIVHSYPHCWRSDTPLMYKAVSSWFLKVESLREQLLHTNSQTYWVPNFVKEKRFHNWLSEARDWGFSRNRFWGTPIPFWMSEDEQIVHCVGSISELEHYAGHKLDDVHRQFIDHITIPDPRGEGYPPLRRIEEVFDCWFESGSMPYGSLHYPFENIEKFEQSFPADFAGEGLDQTRGWFYTMMVLSTGLYNKPAFKNLVVTGMVLANDGKKMSKRLKNYPDLMDITNAHGADAVRVYLINSPVVRADSLRFKEEQVKGVVKDVILPWFHAFRFFVQEATRYETSTGNKFTSLSDQFPSTNNVMDQWILSYMQSLINFVHQEMKAYRLYTVVPRLLLFLEQLTNWYVRLNRDRMKGKLGEDEAFISLSTLFVVLLNTSRLMAPYSPFICEYFYQNLKRGLNTSLPIYQESIHFVMAPNEGPVPFENLVEQVQNMQTVINLGRFLRDKHNQPRKKPLYSMTIIHPDPSYTSSLEQLEVYIKDELNVLDVSYSNDVSNRKLTALPNFKILGARLGSDMKLVQKAIKELSQMQIENFLENGKINLCGHTLENDDIIVQIQPLNVLEKNLYMESDNVVSILMDLTEDDKLNELAQCREVINRIQKMRKEFNFNPMDNINIWLCTDNKQLHTLIQNSYQIFSSALRRPIEISNKLYKPNDILENSEFSFNTENVFVYFTGKKFDHSQNSEMEYLRSSIDKINLQNGNQMADDFTTVR